MSSKANTFEKKYQLIKKTMSAGVNPTIDIDTETDKRYKHINEIAIYTDTAYASSVNLDVASAIQINGEEIIPFNFDTALLFPKLEYARFRRFKKIPASGNRISGRLQYVGTLGADIEVKILLSLTDLV